MKKLFYGILATSLCFVFVACAESNSAPANHETETMTQDTETDTETTEQPMEFVMKWYWFTQSPPPPCEGVVFVVSNVSSEGIEFKFKNNTDDRFVFGRDEFWLFERQDDKWVEMDIWDDRYSFKLALPIHPRQETDTQERFFLYECWGIKPEKTTLDSGEYMFVVPYSQGGASEGFLDHYSARHVFTIE
ncbi:MAG: hypothetical protein FWG45_03900 [Oscillospiraceae bacterium]|nr:hypothetical protein [Oscillospiraceae bacterium]